MSTTSNTTTTKIFAVFGKRADSDQAFGVTAYSTDVEKALQSVAAAYALMGFICDHMLAVDFNEGMTEKGANRFVDDEAVRKTVESVWRSEPDVFGHLVSEDMFHNFMNYVDDFGRSVVGTDVESSVIKRAEHSDLENTLFLEFTSGRCYVYENVPRKVYNELVTAESVGSYFNAHIRRNEEYTFEQVA